MTARLARSHPQSTVRRPVDHGSARSGRHGDSGPADWLASRGWKPFPFQRDVWRLMAGGTLRFAGGADR